MPENPAGDWKEGPDVKPGELAPNNPEAKSAKPMNEATDAELLAYMRDAMCAEALLLWQAAMAATQRLLASPIDPKTGKAWLSPEDRAAAVGMEWKDCLTRFDGLDIIVDHMVWRAENLRIRGIMPGDPRERKLLEVALNIES
jgi:hypothetical protein